MTETVPPEQSSPPAPPAGSAEALAAAGLQVSRDGAVLTVTLARPEARNAQTPATWRALASVGATLPDDVRVVVVRGAGPSFSSGLDRRMFAGGVPGEPSLADLAGSPAATLDATIAGYQAGFSWLREAPVLSVAAVQGHAIGAGLQLALACDLRLLAEDAQLSMREPALGLVPDLGGTWPLVRAVGYERAVEMCVTARTLGAEEAVRIGLAHRVVADLDAAVTALLSAVLANPAGSVRATTSLLRRAAEQGYADQLAAERAAQAERLRSLAAGTG
jgi:enoyl-CoA hydratase/carnithine racemase